MHITDFSPQYSSEGIAKDGAPEAVQSSSRRRRESKGITLSYAGSASHVCHLYHGEDGRKDVALPFIREGLHGGECCIYVAEAGAIDDWYLAFQRYGIDVRGARRDGSLDVVSSIMWREQCYKGSIAMAREVLAVLGQKLREFSAIRIAGDVDWANDPAIPADVLCHWEATANLVFDGFMAKVICQYDIDRYPPAFIIAALRTHPAVLYNGQQVSNPFYEAQRILDRRTDVQPQQQ